MVSNLLGGLIENHDAHPSFRSLADLQVQFNHVAAVIVFFSWVKVGLRSQKPAHDKTYRKIKFDSRLRSFSAYNKALHKSVDGMFLEGMGPHSSQLMDLQKKWVFKRNGSSEEMGL